jgi:hypothetical protein
VTEALPQFADREMIELIAFCFGSKLAMVAK